MSDSERDPLVAEFVARLIEKNQAHRSTAFRETESPDLHEHLRHSIEQAIMSTEIMYGERIIVPTGPGTRYFCAMPNNGHSFSGKGKHCANCGSDYCSQHMLSYCVKCGYKL